MLSFMHSVNKQHIDIPKYGKHGIGRRRAKRELGKKKGKEDGTKGLLPGSVASAAERERKTEKEGEETQRDRQTP